MTDDEDGKTSDAISDAIAALRERADRQGPSVPADDEASKALARALGARYERTYVNIAMGEDELWRHPAPADLATGV